MMRFPLTLNSLFERAGKVFPDVVRLSPQRPDDSTHRYTYKDWHKRAQSLASAFKLRASSKRDRVATLMWNHYLHLEAYFAIPVVGGVLHTLNLRLHPDELTYHRESRGGPISHRGRCTASALRKRSARTGQHRKSLRQLIRRMRPRSAATRTTRNNCRNRAPAAPSPVDLDEEDALGMCYTSGTTGKPKGVVYSHRAIALHSYSISLPDNFSISRNDT